MKFYHNLTPYAKQLPYNILYMPDQFSVCYQYTMYHMETASATSGQKLQLSCVVSKIPY